MSSGEATVAVDCESCPGDAVGRFQETVFQGRLEWSVAHSCVGGITEICGRGTPPEPWRQALLDQCGTYRLRLQGTNPSDVGVMKVLRAGGTALGEVRRALATLRGDGLAGTEAELRLLAARLEDAGAGTRLSREQ